MRRVEFIIVVLLWMVMAAVAADTDKQLVLDKKYAWPREQQIVLDGSWQLAAGDPALKADLLPDFKKMEWFDTTVPTDVHWALVRAGKAPHPYKGLNAKKQRWVEDKAWWFRKNFTVAKDFRGQNLRLIFEGVDYYGHYWLNGRYLGHSEGAFGAVKMTVYGLRYDRPNELVVRVDCAGYKIGHKGRAPHASLVKSELWSGWRVGAEDFNTVGIWQPVRLVANDWPCLERPFVRTVEMGRDFARVAVTAEVYTPLEEDKPCEVIARIRRQGEEEVVAEQRLEMPLIKGVMVLADLELNVPDPALWWPNGLGEQPLYEAEICLSVGGELKDRLLAPFGIRTVERKIGKTQRTSYNIKEWTFTVNDKPMFVKGVNWMPIDALANVDPDDYEWNLRMARDGGIQMIRVWGGGIIETDAFYELCDKLGIMVWQDFSLTCGWRAHDINRKVWQAMSGWTVFRLRNHPSLVFWCGGNEFKPDDRSNGDLVGILAREIRRLDGTRPFMAASPDEGDVHGYPQWDASEAWKKILPGGPFISEWGSHGMPTAQTYREIVGPDESNAVIGPTLLKMDRKLMIEKYPEIAHHWVEFQPNRLIQMLARGSAFDDLATVPLGRFSEAVAAGAGEFYKYSCEASRAAYPQNSGMLLWVWKRPWPIVGIQLVDGMGRPLAVYYEVKRAYSSPWPCLEPPQLNYAVGEQVSMPVRILAEAAASAPKGLKVTVRLVGPDLKNRKLWNDFPLLDVPDGSESVMGPTISFKVADDFARSFFFVLVEIEGADGQPPVRNVYTFRCPPQMEDESFRKQYRAKADKALFIDKGPWLRPQLLKSPTTLSCKLVSATKENDTRFILVADVKNTGDHPAVMTSVEVPGSVCVVADDAGFWMEPGESRRVHLRVRCAKDTPAAALTVEGCAWNVSDSTL